MSVYSMSGAGARHRSSEVNLSRHGVGARGTVNAEADLRQEDEDLKENHLTWSENLDSRGRTTTKEHRVRQLSSSTLQGYVQTPNWNGKTLYPFMDSWTEIRIPEHHKVMVSFQEVNIAGSPKCLFDKISLYSERVLNKYVIHEICTSHKPPVSLYNVSKLYIHFQSVTFNPGTGFRLDFTFHALSALPQQLSDGRWNCSVPHWPDFRLHFPCNLVSDCVGGEDEVDCPYTSHVCGPGFLSANGTCLQFTKTDQNISWNTASKTCESRGMQLTAANTPAEWEATLDILRYRPYEYLLYGLVPPSPPLPYMYSQGLTGLDGIFRHFLPIDIFYLISDCIGIYFTTKSLQCIPVRFECDNFWHCADGLDELMCDHLGYLQAKRGKPFPALIDIDSDGKLRAVKPLSMTREPLCPETYFQCPGSNFYCFPVYLRCNGVFDCPGKQDETACDTYTCPGYYRCRSSHVCLHPDHVCDGWSQCPEGDDELLCDLSCPDTCVCHGLAFTCTAR
ncbi:hypothetical protein C0Q70_02436 [Pomacea canaliculata]|uniref:CUB domain-containing protein n=1 Tax=Pomacea canaliculata TaxID=400727 RepID=A0A2T7PPX3_POMCA|nr:hypothetical protein C0Q70_02436 [Pomacea canaliculata]